MRYEKIGKKFKKATELIRGLTGLSYEERSRVLQLPTLRYLQLRGDMIQLYKYVTNKCGEKFKLQFVYHSMLEMSHDTRGNK